MSPLTSDVRGLPELLRDPVLWQHDNVLIRANAADEIERLRAALQQAETVMTIVEPRSHKAEYLAALAAAREALGTGFENETCAEATTEFCWLVENGDSGDALRYRYMDQMGIHWTPDPHKAIRFARRADAEMFAEGDEDAWRIVEHGFEVGK